MRRGESSRMYSLDPQLTLVRTSETLHLLDVRYTMITGNFLIIFLSYNFFLFRHNNKPFEKTA